VELIADDSDVWGVTGYILNANGLRMRLYKEDVIHWRTYSPNFDAVTRDHLRGFSPLTAGEKLLTANNASKDAMVSMFQNDGAKGILYNETLDNLTPDQVTTLDGVLARKVNNRDIKGAVARFQGKWGYIDLGKSSVDMQLLEAQDTSFSRLCNLFGVSPNLFLAGQTRDNLREARKDLITNKIMPDALSLDDELNRVLAKSFTGQELTTDFSSLPEMQYEMSEMSTVLKDMYDRGIINANEYRDEMGWEETQLPEHQQFFVSANTVTIGEAAMPVMDGMDTTSGQQ
jgi:HK97 family phage portal protein